MQNPTHKKYLQTLLDDINPVKLIYTLLINSLLHPCHRWAQLFSQPAGEQNQMRCPSAKLEKNPVIAKKEKEDNKIALGFFLQKRGW